MTAGAHYGVERVHPPLWPWPHGLLISLPLARMVGESMWKALETHSNKTSTVLRVLKPDTTYQVKVQVQCLNKVHNTNDFVTLRTPEGRECGWARVCSVQDSLVGCRGVSQELLCMGECGACPEAWG